MIIQPSPVPSSSILYYFISFILYTGSVASGYLYLAGNLSSSFLLLCKCLPAFLLAILVVISPFSVSPPVNPSSSVSSVIRTTNQYTFCTAVTLVLCGIADILIDINFIAGLACFLFGHTVYITTLRSRYIVRYTLLPSSPAYDDPKSSFVTVPNVSMRQDGTVITLPYPFVPYLFVILYVCIGIIVAFFLFTESNHNTLNLPKLPTIPPLIIGVIVYMMALLTINIFSSSNFSKALYGVHSLTNFRETGRNILPLDSTLSRTLLPSTTVMTNTSTVTAPLFSSLSLYRFLASPVLSFTGTNFFLVSDTSLAFNLFVGNIGIHNSSQSGSLIIMLTYWIALLCYALSAIYSNRYNTTVEDQLNRYMANNDKGRNRSPHSTATESFPSSTFSDDSASSFSSSSHLTSTFLIMDNYPLKYCSWYRSENSSPE